MTATIQNAPLTAALLLAVPLEILELKSRGGPDDRDLARAKEIGQVIAEKGDVLLFGGGKNGEVRDLLHQLAQGIALLSFTPGGVRLLSQHWCGRAASISAACPGCDNPLCCQHPSDAEKQALRELGELTQTAVWKPGEGGIDG